MTDLKPEDLAPADLCAHIEATAHAAGLSYLTAASSSGYKGSRMDAFRAGVAWVISDPAFTSLLADRARMEKALRETNDALLNAAAALEQLQESSENGAESIKTIGSADPSVTTHMFGLLADSARRAAKFARGGASQ